MKQTLLGAIVALLLGVCFISTPQSSQAGSLKSFAKDEYYLGASGKPPSLSTFAANPRAYLRSEAAYQSLKQGFATALGRSLSDQEFHLMLADGGQVRATRACTGRISTAGINETEKVGWSTRRCYRNEKLIEVNVNGNWLVVASQGCFNLVRPLLPPPPPKLTKVCRFVKTDVQQLSGRMVHSPGIHVHDAYCGHDVSISGMSTYIPGATQSSSREVCEYVPIS